MSCVVKYLINKLAKKWRDVSSSGHIKNIAVGLFMKSFTLNSMLWPQIICSSSASIKSSSFANADENTLIRSVQQ